VIGCNPSVLGGRIEILGDLGFLQVQGNLENLES